MALDINAILAQLQALGPLQVQRQIANRDSVDNGGMGSGAQDTFSADALSRLLPGVRISPMQVMGWQGGDNAGYINDPAGGYDFFYDYGNGDRFLHGTIGPDGRVTGLRDRSDSKGGIGGLIHRVVGGVGNLALDYGPLLVLGAATMGAGLGAAGAGGAGGAAGGTGLTAGAGGVTGLTPGAAGITGVAAPSGFVLAPELGAGAAAGAGAGLAVDAGGGGLNPAAAGQGLRMPTVANLESMGGAQGLTSPSVASAAPAVALAPQTAAAAGGSGFLDTAKQAASALKPYAPYVGPTLSLLSTGMQLGSLPQQPADAPRLPGLEAPPEARGLDPQAGVAPILAVLNRNRRDGRNRTILTGRGGVNMASTRVGSNTLLGM